MNEITMLTDEQLKRFPRAVQIEITRLRAEVIYYKKQLDQMSGEESSPVRWYISHNDQRLLPFNATVSFDNIEVRLTNGEIEILGDDELIMRGEASNHFFVSIRPYPRERS